MLGYYSRMKERCSNIYCNLLNATVITQGFRDDDDESNKTFNYFAILHGG